MPLSTSQSASLRKTLASVKEPFPRIAMRKRTLLAGIWMTSARLTQVIFSLYKISRMLLQLLLQHSRNIGMIYPRNYTSTKDPKSSRIAITNRI